MKLKSSKFTVILLVLSLVFTQLTGIFSVNNVFAEESNSNYSNIVPGKILVKYKNEEGQKTLDIKSKSTLNKTSLNVNIKEITFPEGTDIFQVINDIKKDSNVEYAEPIYIRNALELFATNPKESKTVAQSVYDPNDPYYQWGEQLGLDEINVTDAWKKVSYEERGNITIAIIDTGIDLDHPDLQKNITEGYDFIKDEAINDGYVEVVDDDHGTHVAGIAAAISDNGEGIAGVAGGVKIMPLRVIGSQGATSQDIGDAIKWAADHNADVINMSLGGEGYSQYEYEAVQYALGKGVTIIAATGNESNHWIKYENGDMDYEEGQERYFSSVHYPAAYSGVIGVGAVTTYNSETPIIADFSNIGAKVDVVAPGVGIYSTVPDDYTSMSGTSMATPFVSGLAALILAANNDLTPEQVQDILIESAIDIVEPLGQVGWDSYYGYGLIDGYRAFNIPRIEMELIADDLLDVEQEITVNITTKDYQGTIVDEVYGEAEIFVEKYNFDKKIWINEETLNTVADVVYGESTTKINLYDVGIYRIHADENDDNQWIWSKSGYVMKKPQSPIANISSGAYTATQTISLLTGTTDAQIYYTLDDSNPTIESSLYEEPITISSSKILKAISYKNNITSDISTYNYTINQNAYTGSGGGGGGGGGSPIGNKSDKKDVKKDKLGKTTVFIDVSEDRINKEIQSPENSSIIIDANTTELVDNIQVSLSSNALKKALNNSKNLIIKSNNVNLEIKPGALNIEDTKSVVKLVINEQNTDRASNPIGMNKVSKIFDFNLLEGNKKVEHFNKPIKLTVKFDVTKVKDINRLGVYYYNEEKQEWEYVGGKINAGSTITFETDHFSKYIVMEYDKTFEDIQGHWAKNDIELMAFKHIANGISNNNFAPDRNITRAEFVTLLTKALNMKKINNNNVFNDVAEDSWYKEAVIKAYDANIIKGMDDRKFGPQENITREQMATIIMNAYAYDTDEKLENIITTADVKFKDEGLTSKWARNNVRLSKVTGLMNGNPDGTFMPKASATRAQAIVVIKNLMEKLDII